MIKPTIGRKIWYWETAEQFKLFNFGVENVVTQPFDATIVAVHSPSRVNLFVLDHEGLGMARTSVRLVQDDEIPPDSCFATWMPYRRP